MSSLRRSSQRPLLALHWILLCLDPMSSHLYRHCRLPATRTSEIKRIEQRSPPGRTHITRRFSGIKFLPPGLHLITWTPPPQHATGSNSTPAGPSAIPIRSGLIRYFQPKERYLLRYDPATESVLLPPAGDDTITVITDDRLRTLDREMAAYPFEGLETWKALTSEVTESILRDVVGDMGRLDGMTPVQGDEGSNGKDLNRRGKREWSGKEEQELAAMFGMGDERQLSFAQFDLKRSWRAGAVGEEVTRYSRDKSWLLGTVISRLGGGEHTSTCNTCLGRVADDRFSDTARSFPTRIHLSPPSLVLLFPPRISTDHDTTLPLAVVSRRSKFLFPSSSIEPLRISGSTDLCSSNVHLADPHVGCAAAISSSRCL